MAFDGSAWSESTPDNSNLINEGDDNIRDVKQGVRARLAHEHVFSSSQAATNEGGYHKYVTFQAQTAAPTLVYGTATQVGGVYVTTNKHLTFVDSAGTSFMLAASGAGLVPFGTTGGAGSIPIVTSGGGLVAVTATATGLVLAAQGATASPAWKPLGVRAFCRFDGTTQALYGAYNVSTVTYTGSGSYAVLFTTAMADTNYAVVLSGVQPGGGSTMRGIGADSYTTTGFHIAAQNVSTWMNIENISAVIFGT